MKKLVPAVVALALSIPCGALAGDPGDFCEAVTRSADIYELEFDVKDPPPEKYLGRDWTPEYRHYEKTASTGRVVRIIKGNHYKVGAVVKDWQALKLSIPVWRKLFAAGTFRALAGDLDGWFADDGDCAISLCTGYDDLLRGVTHCLKHPVKKVLETRTDEEILREVENAMRANEVRRGQRNKNK